MILTMSLIQYFSFAAEKNFATTQAAKLSKELPPDFMLKLGKTYTVNKITRLLERVNVSAVEYQKSTSIGFIKRAVLANSYKWELKKHGYPDEFVDMATECLVVDLLKARTALRGK